jgi:hypothetical protein
LRRIRRRSYWTSLQPSSGVRHQYGCRFGPALELCALQSRKLDMRPIPLHDHADLPPAERTALETAIQGLQTLADVLAWAPKQIPPRSVAEIVTQDEYTHDVILEATWRAYLAFDTT